MNRKKYVSLKDRTQENIKNMTPQEQHQLLTEFIRNYPEGLVVTLTYKNEDKIRQEIVFVANVEGKIQKIHDICKEQNEVKKNNEPSIS